MADDTIWNYVDDFARSDISREAFWELVKFKYPTHQIVFLYRGCVKTTSFQKELFFMINKYFEDEEIKQNDLFFASSP